MTAGSTTGDYTTSATTQRFHDEVKKICDGLIEALDKLAAAIPEKIRQLLEPLPGPVAEQVADWLADKINELWDRQLRPALQNLFTNIAENVTPWLAAPFTLQEVGLKWNDVVLSSSSLTGQMAMSVVGNVHQFGISEWKGAGQGNYSATITVFHDYSAGMTDLLRQLREALAKASDAMMTAATGLIMQAGGLFAAITGLIGAFITSETGLGAVIGVIVAVIGALLELIGVIVTIVGVVQALGSDLNTEIAGLTDKMAALNEKGPSWPEPSRQIGGTGLDGKPRWDDGS